MTRPGNPFLPLDAPIPGSSFTDLLASIGATPPMPEGLGRIEVPEGTTVLALRHQDGVVMAGDRRSTEGHLVAHRQIRKVFPADHFSAVAIAGTAGMAVEMVRLFQVELEHYEKIEGTRLSLEGKANFLSRLVRNHLPMAMQGLVVVPLFAGYDEAEGRGRLFSFDAVGGRYEELDYGATGSGSRLAKSYLRTVFRPDLTRQEAIDAAVAALVAAAEDDTATGGPDLIRGIYPNLYTMGPGGVEEIDDDIVRVSAETAVRGSS
jgi:proteasome beta subunit